VTNRAPATLIVQADGSMIPTVQCTAPGEGDPSDKRRHRTLSWKEARLSLVRRPEEVEPVFAVTLASVDAVGEDMKRLALAKGLRPKTRIHALGDGAPWIAEQVECQFGDQGRYLVDFYHVCDYLAAAAPRCDPEQPSRWLEKQKENLKTGAMKQVLAALTAHLEPEKSDEATPVRDCHRYLINRPSQFNYAAAIAANLPIGSGEVESAHRYIIQKRLKLPGAWWRMDNAQAMLNLRCLRANHRWQDCWERIAA
jgi:hypothetical protein